MVRILLIEHDPVAAAATTLLLESSGHTVHTANLGQNGYEIACNGEIDFVVLELCLPDLGGFAVLKALRENGITVPVFILTTVSDVDIKVACLNAGADQYMTKPFHTEEFRLLVEAVIRRSCMHEARRVSIGTIAIDFQDRRVWARKREVRLSTNEYGILELLAKRHGSIVSKSLLMQHLYANNPTPPETKIIDVVVCSLRKKIAALNDGVHGIETHWGRGYSLRDPSAEPIAA